MSDAADEKELETTENPVQAETEAVAPVSDEDD